MTYEELITALAERYDALGALDEDGSLAIEVDGTLVSFRKANDAATIVAHVCEMPEDAQGRVASLLLKASALMAAATSCRSVRKTANCSTRWRDLSAKGRVSVTGSK